MMMRVLNRIATVIADACDRRVMSLHSGVEVDFETGERLCLLHGRNRREWPCSDWAGAFQRMSERERGGDT